MQTLLAVTMAASALAIISNADAVHALPLGGQAAGPVAAVEKVQQRRKSRKPWISRHRRRMGQPRGPRGFKMSLGYGYITGCAWLRRRALDTGSRYLWRQYRQCMR